MQHDIFSTPNNVELTVIDRRTPSSYANYPQGRKLAATMPTWRVQTEGFLTHPGQLVGVVARDAGFLDSPDAEWISGGTNSKGPAAVALGRHGNFFHWGFAASPTYLTAEAQDVFVNAIHYIHRFDRQAPIARKARGTRMRSALDNAIERISDTGYARVVAQYDARRNEAAARKAAIQKRLDAGQDISDRDRRELARQPLPNPDRLAPARRLLSEEAMQPLGDDATNVIEYLRQIRPYVRPSGWYTLAVDEDLRWLGVGNADPAMLSRAVELLATKEHAALGQRLLERYTDQQLETHEAWSRWLQQHRQRLFFTEAGGYKWLVNTIEATTTRAG
ncbi:MAG: hypothetical protein AAF581_06055 [Planctomycetota bacterium]